MSCDQTPSSIEMRLRIIEEHLMAALPQDLDTAWLDRIAGERLQVSNLSWYREFCEPARDLLLRGGKRWRPLLMVLTAEAFGGERSAKRAYGLTPVVEFPHTGSLIIDDIEDGSDWRRGRPAVHTIYGTDLSINAGNLLYYLPTTEIDAAEMGDDLRLEVYRIYARFLRRVHLGQGLDIVWHRDSGCVRLPEIDEYLQMCRFKTGCLAGMSAEIGAAVGGCEQSLIRQVGKIAELLGVGFQIRDDVINLESGNPGKQRGDDIIENKKSLPILLHLKSRPEDLPLIVEAFAEAKEKGCEAGTSAIERVISRLQDSGALARACERAEELLDEVLRSIGEIYPDCEARDLLIGMVKGFRSGS